MRNLIWSKGGSNVSRVVVWCCIFVFGALIALNMPGNAMSWDVFGYYLYLPSLFIYHDLGLDNIQWVESIVEIYKNSDTLYQFSKTPLGHNVIQYPTGIAILSLPFFLLGHLSAIVVGAPLDGFSDPYQIAFVFGGFFYMALGILCLRKVLLTFCSDQVVAIALIAIAFGTNYFHLNIWNIGMSHNYLFALYAVLIWQTIKWYENPSTKKSVVMGLTIGLIVVVRPTEIVCVLIPLLYGFKSLSDTISLLKNNVKQLIWIVLSVFLVGVPQIIYWKIYSGQFLYVSYRNPGEGFDFLTPHILNVLFSFRKGWLIYTPMMICALVGIYWMWRKKSVLYWAVLSFFVINLYLVSSWSVWWYATSFSQRALMQSYAVMAIPLGIFISHIHGLKKLFRWSLFGLGGCFIVLNLFQIWQCNQGILKGNRMTADYYFSTFGQTSPPTQEQQNLLSIYRSTTAIEHFNNQDEYEIVYQNILDFEEGKSANKFDDPDSNSSFLIGRGSEFSPALRTSFSTLTTKDHAWVKASMWVYPDSNWTKTLLSMVVTFEHGHGKNYKYRTVDLEKCDHIVPGKWNKLELAYLTPEVRAKSDNLVVYAWYRGGDNILVDDIEIKSFVKRD